MGVSQGPAKVKSASETSARMRKGSVVRPVTAELASLRIPQWRMVPFGGRVRQRLAALRATRAGDVRKQVATRFAAVALPRDRGQMLAYSRRRPGANGYENQRCPDPRSEPARYVGPSQPEQTENHLANAGNSKDDHGQDQSTIDQRIPVPARLVQVGFDLRVVDAGEIGSRGVIRIFAAFGHRIVPHQTTAIRLPTKAPLWRVSLLQLQPECA